MVNTLTDTTGRIFDIQRFSIHDGPGIRTIVFLKGCRLRCRWCCNPESQEYAIQKMVNKSGKATVTGRDVTAGEVMETVLRDVAYYRRSGGGLTLSGGEMLCQSDFSKALLQLGNENGINTAVETTSLAPFDDIERLLPYIDHYLMDIKHMNPEKHKEYTGSSNELILENAVKISKKAKHMIVRVPVIPGFNDTPAEISDIARFAAELHGVQELHLLPYHRLGQDKYAMLGRTYALPDILPPSNAHIESLMTEAKKSGLNVQIGG